MIDPPGILITPLLLVTEIFFPKSKAQCMRGGGGSSGNPTPAYTWIQASTPIIFAKFHKEQHVTFFWMDFFFKKQ